VNTTYFSVGEALFFVIMYAIGFTFVSVVNLQNQRANPFIGKDGTYKDIKWTVVIAAMMYVLAGTVTLRSKEDLSGYCKSDPHNFELLRDVDSRRLTFFNLTAAQVAVDQPLV
jgi:hypothetical protein